MSDPIRRALEALGHGEVLASVTLRGKRHAIDALGEHARACFAALNRPVLAGALAEAGRGSSALKGRLLWLLGQDEAARRVLERAALRKAERGEALAYLGVCETPRDPRRALRSFNEASSPHLPLWRAAALLELGGKRSDAALQELERAPASWTASVLKAFAFLESARYAEASAQADALIAECPDRGAGYGLRALARLCLGDWASADRDFNENKDRDPDTGFDLADWSLDDRGKSSEESLALLERALAKHPRMSCFFVVRAEILRGLGVFRYEEAAEDYRRAEALEPARAWLQAHLGRAEGQLQGLEASLRRLDRAVGLYPRGGWIYAWRGECKRLMGRRGEALADFDLATRLAPWYSYGHAWRGAALASLARWGEALRSLDIALDIGPNFSTTAMAHRARGECRRALGDVAGASADAIAAFRLNPKYEWTGALAELDDLLAAQPKNAWARACRGLAKSKAGDARGAERDFAKALALDAKVWIAAEALARKELAAGDAARALELLTRAENETTVGASFFALKGEVLLGLGRARPALAELSKAIALDRQFARARELMAQAAAR